MKKCIRCGTSTGGVLAERLGYAGPQCERCVGKIEKLLSQIRRGHQKKAAGAA